MRARRFLAGAGAMIASAGLVFLAGAACGGKVGSSTFGPAFGDETKYGIGAEPILAGTDARDDRLVMHGGLTLASMHFRAIYIGTPGVDAPPSADAFLGWLGTSNYWAILSEYGIGAATYDGATNLTTSDVFPSGMIQSGLVPFATFEARVHELIHGGEEGGASEIPHADAYAFFLPDGVNVDSGLNSGQEQVTCVTSSAYHAYDGDEPYAVLPPCDDGRSTISISHELAEIATDPILGQGWSSDDPDDIKNGAEIADVCYRAATHPVDGYSVAELWSNANGDCFPK